MFCKLLDLAFHIDVEWAVEVVTPLRAVSAGCVRSPTPPKATGGPALLSVSSPGGNFDSPRW